MLNLFSGFKNKPVARIAVNAKPSHGPWGGGNQWLAQFSRLARYQGFEVVSKLDESVDAVVVLHTAKQPEATFQAEEIKALRKRKTKLVCLQRINENDARKGTNHVDAAIREMSEAADYVVFVSSWLRDYHAERWFDVKRPHESIINGADSRYFHPIGANVWDGRNGPFVLVTHHWSDNWNKGFDLYRDVDTLIANGRLPGVELRIVGRWPADLKWRAAKIVAPASGRALAHELRLCHGYITGTKAEPGAMHYIEGLQCGLPLIYRQGGGGVEEVAQSRGGLLIGADLEQAVKSFVASYSTRRKQVLENLPSGEKMALRYLEIVKSLLASR